MKKNGGINFLTEFDGKGLNVGVRFPILKSTYINFGVTHFEDFGDFATEDDVADWRPLSGDAPSITFGIGLNVPRIYDLDDEANSQGYDGDGDVRPLLYLPSSRRFVLHHKFLKLIIPT